MNNPFKLDNKTALVTGASSGLGREFAKVLAEAGANVVAAARRLPKLQETADIVRRDVGGEVYCLGLDVNESSSIAAGFDAAEEHFGVVDIIVNNAGWAGCAPVPEMDEQMWDRIMDTNVKAPYLVSRNLLPAMLEAGDGGAILFNASTSGKSANANWTAYNASKHAMLQFMKCLAMEVGEQDIRVNAICPGWAESKMATAAIRKTAEKSGEDFDAAYARTMRGNMLGALIGPESLADMAVYLAGQQGRYITGQAINVCGGVNYH